MALLQHPTRWISYAVPTLIGGVAYAAFLMGHITPSICLCIEVALQAFVAREIAFRSAKLWFQKRRSDSSADPLQGARLRRDLMWRLCVVSITMAGTAIALIVALRRFFPYPELLAGHAWEWNGPSVLGHQPWALIDLATFVLQSNLYLAIVVAPLCLSVLFSKRRFNITQPFTDYPVLKIVLFVLCYIFFVSHFYFVLTAAPASQPTPLLKDTPFAILAALTLTASHTVLFLVMYLVAGVTVMPRAVPRMLPRALLGSLTIALCLGLSFWQVPGDPETAGMRFSEAYRLSIVPLIGMLPILAVTIYGSPHTPGALRPQRWTGTQLAVDLVRGSLVLGAVIQRHLPFFVIGLPFSALAVPDVWGFRSDNQLSRMDVWVAATLGWAGPLMSGLLSLEDSFTAAYAIGLRRAVLRLREHVLILGYGDLGRRVARELISKEIVSYASIFENIAFARNILLPNGRLSKVLLRIAAVDADATQLNSVTSTAGGVVLGVHDIRRDVPKPPTQGEDRELPADIVIPVILGDATSADIQDQAGMRTATFVACTIRGGDTTEPSQRVLERLERLAERGRSVPAVLALHSSAYIHQVTERVMRHALPVHWILTSHLEGLNAANVVHAAVMAQRAETKRTPRVLVCGRGSRLLYFIDCLMRSLDEKVVTSSVAAPWLVVVTDDSRLTDLADGSTPERGIVNFRALIGRMPANTDTTVNGYVTGATFPVTIVKRTGIGYQTIARLLEQEAYEIVTILDHDADTETRLMNSVFSNASWIASWPPLQRQGGNDAAKTDMPPLVFVSGETGKPYFQAYFRRALSYYSGVWHKRWSAVRRSQAPGQGIDRTGEGDYIARGAPFVDVLDDPTERILALAWAYLDRQERERVVELHFCEPDVPSAMVQRLASLVGKAFQPPQKEVSLSLVNTRFIPRDRRRFIIRSFVHAITPTKTAGQETPDKLVRRRRDADFFRLAMVSGHERDARRDEALDIVDAVRILRRVRSSPAHGKGEQDVADSYLATLERLKDTPVELNDILVDYRQSPEARHKLESIVRGFAAAGKQVVKQVDHCCGMPTCPVEAHHKCAEARFQPSATDSATAEGYPEFRADRATANQLRHTRQIATRLFANRLQPPAAPPLPRSGLAMFRVDGVDLSVEGGDGIPGPGALADVIAKLLLGKLTTGPKDRTGPLVSLTYLSSNECHDQRFGVFSCYGRLLEPDAAAKDEMSDIESVTITPFYEDELAFWENYARSLASHLGRGYEYHALSGEHDDMGRRYEVRRPRPSERANS